MHIKKLFNIEGRIAVVTGEKEDWLGIVVLKLTTKTIL